MPPAQADNTAQTDLASILVTPLHRQDSAPVTWQTIYDYSGGTLLPPGTRIVAEGKWKDPVVRMDDKGVTFSFPEIPDTPTASQPLNLGFVYERPIAGYPTRATIHYTSYYDQTVHDPSHWWGAFLITTGVTTYRTFVSQLRGLGHGGITNLPFQAVGANTLVFNFDNKGGLSFTADGQDANSLLADDAHNAGVKTGAMLMPGFAIRNHTMQQPFNKGDWFAINSFKIEQLRPSLEVSSVAEVDLTVNGDKPVDTTIEVVDDHNDSHGFVLRDAPVSPGHYKLFWDGIDQKQSQPKATGWVGAGNYSFHLTTSHAQVHYAGDVNNSTPKFNSESYGLVNCTSLAMTPPGTTTFPPGDPFTFTDKRVFSMDDSVQLNCIDYDSSQGQWIGADGTLINPKTGTPNMQFGRGLAVTPPDPAAPQDPTKQYFFCSKAIGNGDAVVSCNLPALLNIPGPKKLSSPDWNRPPAGFMPYKVHFGQISIDMLGQQHRLLFPTSDLGGEVTHANWIFRNVRVYEDNMAEPSPVRFDPALFNQRLKPPGTNPLPVIPPGSLTVADGGRSVVLNNCISVDYPLEYKVTSHTILAFEIKVIDASGCNLGNGIGLSPDTSRQEQDMAHCINILGQICDGSTRFGSYDASLGAYTYPSYEPNTLYTDSTALPPFNTGVNIDNNVLWRPGFYGLKVSEDGHLLFACNNADQRLEVRDISTDGHAIAKIPIDDPMYVTWAPEGAAGAPKGVRYIYVDSTSLGILRIPWHIADSKFGRPQILTPAHEFAYPRGLTYSAADHRLFLCDTFNLRRSKVANQIVEIDPQTGAVLTRFGKKGGVDPATGGEIDDHVFSCPLTIDADSKGALWVNDYYTCEVRKYNFQSETNELKLERRVLGSNYTNIAHCYWMPGDPPTRAWTMAQFFVRTDADIDSDGLFTNPRTTSTSYALPVDQLRPYAHFEKIDGQVYGVSYQQVFQRVENRWKAVARFGMGAGDVAHQAGLLALPGQPPTELDKAIAASGDKDWAQRAWAWTDLDGDEKISYSAGKPEFQIAFNSKLAFDGYIPPSGCLRPSDAAYIHSAHQGLLVIPPTKFDGHLLYTWQNAIVVPRATDEQASDVIAQDGHYYVLYESAQRHDMGDDVNNRIECYDESGKLLWTRDHDDYSLVCLQPLGNGLISIMDRGGWNTDCPVLIRTSDGDLVSQVFCRRAGDCWSNGVLRVDDDTAYVSLVQAYKVTGLSSARSAAAIAQLPAAGN